MELALSALIHRNGSSPILPQYLPGSSPFAGNFLVSLVYRVQHKISSLDSMS